MNHFPELAHGFVHIGTAPITDAEFGAARFVELIVGGTAIFGCAAAGIEIIVENNAVDIVVFNHFFTHFQQVVARGLEPGIEHYAVVHLHQYAGFEHGFVDVGLGVVAAAVAEAEGIHPCINFQAALVAFFHGKCQWVPSRVFASGAGQVARPWFVAGFIEGICHRANLQAHRIHIGFHKAVEHVGKLLFLLSNHRGAGAFGLGPINV